MAGNYLVQCFNCLSDFDALEAIWCSCNPQRPTKVCPFCLGCFCAAGQDFKDAFWRDAPDSMREETRTLAQSRMLIGEMLVRSGVITTTQLLDALNRQKIDGRRLGEILVDSGALPPDRLDRFLQSQHTVAAVDLSRARIDAMMLRRLGVDHCLHENILPLESEAFRDKHIMTLVMADPSNSAAVERVMKTTGYQVIPGVAPADAIAAAIRSIFPHGSATPPDGVPPAPSRSGTPTEGASAPVPMRILETAVRRRVSHIHIQNQRGVVKVFYRIDGSLYHDRSRASSDAVVALKAFRGMAGLEGAARLVPRAGRALLSIEGIEHQIIVRSRPGREGEELSVKIIDPVGFPRRLDDLGFPDGVVERLRVVLEKDSGLIVVSAPPCSGASSTLYALVMEIAAQGRPLCVVESPRAVNLTDVEQLEFFPEIRDSFRDALARAGTSGAKVVAITAWDGVSWKGRSSGLSERKLVICKVEARTLPEALLRLATAGYPPPAMGSRPTLVLHQRLVRRVCPSCRREAGTAQEHARALGVPVEDARRIRLWRGTGCDACAPTTGLRGRVPLAHTLKLTGSVAEAVASKASEAVLAACRGAGMSSLQKEALAALEAGLTTPEEISRKQLA
ncbi:MAG TPA: ATPase, T2SS/T4P/T4SS family [Candidatus Polarisedimenticolia bacterium]|jgi:type II secretory ATPase GspE/PulE/Tfp pilus assembly ATPase PilB-like protein